MEAAKIIRLISESSDPMVIAVRELHASESPPPGKKWVSGGVRPHCAGCETGDPYLDPEWPCETLAVVAAVLEGREGHVSMGKSFGAVLGILLRLVTILAILWIGNLLISNSVNTYHDTRVICEQVTNHSPDCR